MNIKSNLQKLYSRISTRGFLKSVLTLSSGVVMAQAINLLGMPVVGRIYNAAAMGDYTLITANAAVISTVACLGMMTSFMLPKEHEEARGLSRLVACSTVLITTLLITMLWLGRGRFRIFRTEQITYGVSLLVLWLYIVSYTISNICYAYVNRHKLYRVMFWNPIITAGINVGMGIAFGLMGWGFVGYTAAHILSFVVNIVHLTIHANAFAGIEDPAYRCIPLLKSYKRFPLYQMPANLISTLGKQLPVQMIETIYSATVLGMYSMAIKILSLPMMLLANPVNRVYFQEASARYARGEDIGEFSFKILETNLKIAVVPIAVLTLLGEWIFAIFLGEQWRRAGTVAAILGSYYLVQFCAGCLSGAFVIIYRNNWNLYVALYELLSNILLFFVVAMWKPNELIALGLVALGGSVSVFLSQGIFLKLVGFPLYRYGVLILKFVLLPMAMTWGLRSLIW